MEMKKWERPELQELAISATAQGSKITTSWDEIRVDQNGKYWAGMASGNSSVTPVGPIIVPVED